jgi:Protein of unknown function (DUF3014)
VKNASLAVVAAVLLALIGFGVWKWLYEPAPAISMPAPAAPLPVAEAPAPVASEPGIKYPLETAAAASEPMASPPPNLEASLSDLFGRKTLLSLFQFDDFARRVVATVDNLGRPAAPARLWPLNPAPGKFTVIKQGEVETISPDNGLRYTPHVLLLENVDLAQAVALYKRHYPEFQQAYEELGYPRRYFNDRLVDVIDLLLATPEPAGPIQVRLPVINGPVQPQRPWVLYEYEDPALQTLSSGQQILVRMGPVNQRRVKARLAEVRALVASPRR